MRVSRDLIVLLLLFAVIAGLTAVLGIKQNETARQQDQEPYSSYSAQGDGALALETWLGVLGYHPQRLEGDTFAVDSQVRALFVLAPQLDFTTSEARDLRQWVERGNTLILCSGFTNDRQLANEFRVGVEFGNSVLQDTPVEQPIAGVPAIPVHVETFNALAPARSDYVTYLSAGGKPLLVSFRQGQGRVWFCSAPYLFSNEGLQYDGNAELVGALLAATPRGSVVAFDEFHLSSTRTTPSVQTLLYTTPWGWALLLFALVLGVYLVLNGKRFGRVRPLPQELARRNPAEYVVSMAQLFRRAGKRELALRHYHQQLKRRLARPYGFSPDLPDPEFVATLARFREHLDRDALLETLHGLSQKHVDEKTLVKLAEHAASNFTNKG